MSLPGCYLEESLEEWLEKMTALRWQEEKDMRQTKLLIGEQPNKTCLCKVRKLERRRLRLIVGWLMGHKKSELPPLQIGSQSDYRLQVVPRGEKNDGAPMRMSLLGGALTNGIWISSPGSRAIERGGSWWPDIPRGKNRKEDGLKEWERSWHNGLEA